MQAGRFPGRYVRRHAPSTLGQPGRAHDRRPLTGEFYVDNAGDLYFCKIGGNGKAAKWIKLA
jgi:hypothetical protein